MPWKLLCLRWAPKRARSCARRPGARNSAVTFVLLMHRWEPWSRHPRSGVLDPTAGCGASSAKKSARRRILPIEGPQHVIQLGLGLPERSRLVEEVLGDHGKELR